MAKNVVTTTQKTKNALHGYYALYFKSRKDFSNKSTWRKEKLPSDWTEGEIEQAAKLAGVEGYAIINLDTNFIDTFKWFVK